MVMNYKPNTTTTEFAPAQRIDREVIQAMKSTSYIKLHNQAVRNFNSKK